MAIKPLTRSGWCLKLPLSQYNQKEHDGCAKNFSTSVCTCECGHKGERTLESRGMVFLPYIPPKKQLITKKEEDNEDV